MSKPNGHMEVQETKHGARVYLNGQELFVLADSFEVECPGPKALPKVTMTIIPKTLLIRTQEAGE